MKLLLLLLSFQLIAAERPEMRKFAVKLQALKLLNSDHCSELGSHEGECKKHFKKLMRKKVEAINHMYISDKVNERMEVLKAIMIEEQLLKKYRKLCDKLGISYLQSEDSASLKAKYDAKREELRIARLILNIKERLAELGASYSQDDSLEQLQEKLRLAEEKADE